MGLAIRQERLVTDLRRWSREAIKGEDFTTHLFSRAVNSNAALSLM
jgi:hypothetical protein